MFNNPYRCLKNCSKTNKLRSSKATFDLIGNKFIKITEVTENSVIFDTPVAATFAKADTKLNITLVTSSSQDNAALLKQLKSSFKRIVTDLIINSQ